MASPKLNRRRALFVLGKIDEILAWEKTKEQERDVRYVDLGRYLCEVTTVRLKIEQNQLARVIE